MPPCVAARASGSALSSAAVAPSHPPAPAARRAVGGRRTEPAGQVDGMPRIGSAIGACGWAGCSARSGVAAPTGATRALAPRLVLSRRDAVLPDGASALAVTLADAVAAAADKRNKKAPGLATGGLCELVVRYAACRRGSRFLFGRVRGGRGLVSPSGTNSFARSWCAENGIGGTACRHAAHWQRVWCMLGGSLRISRMSRAASRRERPARTARPSASMSCCTLQRPAQRHSRMP